jgi:hypothetical protein
MMPAPREFPFAWMRPLDIDVEVLLRYAHFGKVHTARGEVNLV